MYGIALEGGGTKGAYHIGAVKAIFECGYEVGAVVGTSIGAFNAAVIAQGDFNKLYEEWNNADSTIAIDLDKKELKKINSGKMDISSIKYWYNYITKNVSDKGIDTTKLYELYSSFIDEEKLRKSNIEYGLVTYSLTDKKPVYVYKEDIAQGKLVDYVLASSNLPVFKQQKLIDGKNYLDGGFYDNCPIILLKNKNITDIFEVRTEAIGISRRIDRKKLNIYTISPSKELGSLLFSDNNTMKKNILMGYFDAIRVIKGYIGTKYYIKPCDDDKILSLILNISDEEILSLAKYMRLSEEVKKWEPRKILFEKILPYISNRLNKEDMLSYQRVIVANLEEIAEAAKIEMYKLYTFEEFINICHKQLKKQLKEEQEAFISNNSELLVLNFLKLIHEKINEKDK